MRVFLPLFIALSFFQPADFSLADKSTNSASPPIASIQPHVTEIHGRKLVDNYFWLREKSKPEVRAYLEAENAYTDAAMQPTSGFQKTLYEEMLARVKETDVDVPYREGNYWYYTRTEIGKQYKIYCRKKETVEAKEEIILDLNQLAQGKPFISISVFKVSPNGKYLAYSFDDTGFRQYTLAVKNLESGETLKDRAERVGSVQWANDNQTIFFTQEDDVSKRQYRLYRHALGAKNDDLLFEEKDERFSLGASKSRDQAYIFLVSKSLTSSEAQYVSANTPLMNFKLMQPRRAEIEYYPDHSEGLFYFRTNDKGQNFRLVNSSPQNTSSEHWNEVLAHRTDVMLENVEFFKNRYVLEERQSGLPTLTIVDASTQKATPIQFPEQAYSASAHINREYNSEDFRYAYESPTTSSSIFSYDFETRKSRLLKQKGVPKYDASKYQVERLEALAHDKVKVPITVIRLKSKRPEQNGPLYLRGYGSYGYAWDPNFNSDLFSLVDRGVVVAIAHIRGGGELGKAWHEGGRMMRKKTTFTDFISCAEHLIAKGFGSSKRLVVEGGSAGGLLMGAIANLRPDLFKAVILKVPFVDVINTMLDESLPLTVGEFEEWGNPKEKAAFDYMLSYSPYDNIAAKTYPDMLVKTSLNDSQVMYWEPAKYVAKMRATRTDKNTLLFKTNLNPAGHGGASGRYDKLKETAFDYAYILKEMGLTR